MRIAQIVENLSVGGLERMAVDLSIAQKAAGHEVFLYCVTHAGPLAQRAEAAGLPVKAFLKAPGFSARTVWDIRRQLRADRIEIVHTHNSIIHHYGAAAAVFTGIPVVNTEHGMGSLTLNPRQMRIFRSTLPFTTAVVFVAEEPKRFLCDSISLSPSKAHVIVNGIPTRAFAENPAGPGGSPPRFRFGTVARLVPVKDHATMLKAFAQAASAHPAAELHIVGYGILEGRIRALAAELGLGDRFRLLPPDTDVPAFLHGLDAFVLSSETEGLPLCILEAMAAGLPLVSTRVGGIPEVAPEGEVAWYAPPGDPAAMAAAMAAAIASPDLAARGRRAAAIVAERFSVDTMQRRYEALYARLLGRKAAQAAPMASSI